MSKWRSVFIGLGLPLVLLVSGGCKDKSDKSDKSSRPAPKTSLGTGRIPAAESSVKPMLTGYPSLDRRPGPKHAERQRVAEKLERCLLSAQAGAADCFVDTVRARLIDAVPPVEASGKEAVTAMVKGGFGLGLTGVKSKPIVTAVKGREAVLIVHVQGVASGAFLGVTPGQDKPISLVPAIYVRYDTSENITEVHAYIDQLGALGQVGGATVAFRPAAPEPKEEPVRALASGYGSEAKNLQAFAPLTDDMDQHDQKLMARYYRPDAVISRSWQPADVKGVGPILDSYGVEFTGSSNARHTVKLEWVAQDHVVMLLERSGTSTGPLFGTDTATKRSYTVQELHIMRMREELIDKHWVFVNGLGLASQIGVDLSVQ